jgi:hypothetical protein
VTDEKVPLAIIDTSSCDADLKVLRILFSQFAFARTDILIFLGDCAPHQERGLGGPRGVT